METRIGGIGTPGYRAVEVTGIRRSSGWSETLQGAEAASFADVLLLARSVLPEALIGERGWERLAAWAGRLPPSAADAMFGFECRLDDASAEASADVLLSVHPDAPFADALVRDGASGGPMARALARFLSDLKRPGSPFAGRVDLVALEYDVAGVEGSPAPGVFLRGTGDAGHTGAGLLATAIALAAGWNVEPAERNGLADILAALPPGGAVRWAGAFPDRRPRALRLLVRGLGSDGAAFLSRIGWTGDASALEGIASAFRACGVDNHVLALDLVEGRVAPGIGLELSRMGRSGGWREAIDMMARKGWCRPEKAAALGLAAGSERIWSRAGLSELHCGIHHVKLTLSGRDASASGGSITGAKGYIGCVLRPLP